MSAPATMGGARSLWHRITHVGVDPAAPRRETKHITLTNAYALFVLFVFTTSVALGGVNALRSDVRAMLVVGALASLVPLALNAARQPFAATSCLLAVNSIVFFWVGIHEPGVTEHEGIFSLNAVVSFFLYPRKRQLASAFWVLVSLGCVIAMRAVLHDDTPAQEPGFDAYGVGTSNVVIGIVTFAFFSNRASAEIDRVENELVDERKKTETILKREVAHQVAERSRELGSALAQGSGVTPRATSPGGLGDRYKVLRPLGEGGMGAVFEVERVTDGARLALKVMTGVVSREQAARFAREAEIGARVHHENLVAIVDIGMADGGAPYLVMELATGGSLEGQRARFGDVPWALSMLRPMIRGLVALHRAGVVHRDLKPANVLLTADGRAQLSDFGIARMRTIPMGAVDVEAETVTPASEGALTGTGAWIGTPLYMAPEAARGAREAAPTVDVFAFGLVAHELLTGALPFATPPVLLALVGQPLPPVAPIAAAGLSDRARQALAACLAADAQARPTAEELRDALDAGPT